MLSLTQKDKMQVGIFVVGNDRIRNRGFCLYLLIKEWMDRWIFAALSFTMR